jgi:ABC-type multidrug transport system fused ATPase/permease subunit
LLILQLGPSALAGFAFFLLATPILSYIMKQLFKLRAKSMVWTDKRAKLIQELMGGMRVIKFFAWEVPFVKRVNEYRKKELQLASSFGFLWHP